MEKPAVLLLERDATLIDVAQRCLPDEIELHVAKTLEMALRVAARRPLAVVILDMPLTGAAPAETVAKLRAHQPALRVIFLAERTADVDRRHTQLGFVLRKPVTSERLADAVRAALRLQGMSTGVERMRSSSGTFRAVHLPETPARGTPVSTLSPPPSDRIPIDEAPADRESGERPRTATPAEPPPHPATPSEPAKRSLTPPPFARLR